MQLLGSGTGLHNVLNAADRRDPPPGVWRNRNHLFFMIPTDDAVAPYKFICLSRGEGGYCIGRWGAFSSAEHKWTQNEYDFDQHGRLEKALLNYPRRSTEAHEQQALALLVEMRTHPNCEVSEEVFRRELLKTYGLRLYWERAS